MDEEKFYEERLLSNPEYKVFIPEEKWIRRAKVNETGFKSKQIRYVTCLTNDSRKGIKTRKMFQENRGGVNINYYWKIFVLLLVYLFV